MSMDIQNVDVADHGSSPKYSRIALSWEYGGARFHLWESDKEKVLYKNSIAQRYQPGHFETRKLNPSTTTNARMIAEARAIAEREGLYEKAAEKMRAKEQAEEAARTARFVKMQKEQAAEEMYALLTKLRYEMIVAGWTKAVREWDAIVARVEGSAK